MELGTAGDPSTLFAHLHGGDAAVGGEAFGEFVVGVGLRLVERVNLVLVDR